MVYSRSAETIVAKDFDDIVMPSEQGRFVHLFLPLCAQIALEIAMVFLAGV